VPFPSDEKLYTCYYCGLHHKEVEAGGIYSCPNVLCWGPGGAWFRSECKSYKEDADGNKHTVDHEEWIGRALFYASTLDGEDPELAAAIRKCAEQMNKGERSNLRKYGTKGWDK
jgi:hypothetical protein